MLKIQRIADPQLSPDGKTVAFAVTTPDIDGNMSAHSVWTVPLEGGAPHKLADMADRPRWSPDGKRIYYVSTTGDSSQIWSMNPGWLRRHRRSRTLSTEADGEITFPPDGKYILVTSNVYPDCGADDACNKKHLDAEKDSKVKARIITSAFSTATGHAWAGNRRAAICSPSHSADRQNGRPHPGRS